MENEPSLKRAINLVVFIVTFTLLGLGLGIYLDAIILGTCYGLFAGIMMGALTEKPLR